MPAHSLWHQLRSHLLQEVLYQRQGPNCKYKPEQVPYLPGWGGRKRRSRGQLAYFILLLTLSGKLDARAYTAKRQSQDLHPGFLTPGFAVLTSRIYSFQILSHHNWNKNTSLKSSWRKCTDPWEYTSVPPPIIPVRETLIYWSSSEVC